MPASLRKFRLMKFDGLFESYKRFEGWVWLFLFRFLEPVWFKQFFALAILYLMLIFQPLFVFLLSLSSNSVITDIYIGGAIYQLTVLPWALPYQDYWLSTVYFESLLSFYSIGFLFSKGSIKVFLEHLRAHLAKNILSLQFGVFYLASIYIISC